MSSSSKSVSEGGLCSKGDEGEMTSMEEVDHDLEVLTAASKQFVSLNQQGVKVDGDFGPGLVTVRKNMEGLKQRFLEGERERVRLEGENAELKDERRVLKRRLEVKDGALERMRKDHSLEMDRRIRTEVELKRIKSTLVVPRSQQGMMQQPLPPVPTADVSVETGGRNLRVADAETTRKPVRVVRLIERKREYWECSDSSSEPDGESDTDSDEDVEGWRFPHEVSSQKPLPITTQPALVEGNIDGIAEVEKIASASAEVSTEDISVEPAEQLHSYGRGKRTRAKAKEGQSQVPAAIGLHGTGQDRKSPDQGHVSHSRKQKGASIVTPIRSSRRLDIRSTQGLTIANPPKFARSQVEVPYKQCGPQNVRSSRRALKSPDPQPDQKRTFVCTTCSRAFSIRSDLNQHMRARHSHNRPFQCPQCPARFKLKKYLTTHMVVHSDQKPFKCPKCPARFKRKNDLQSHMLYKHSNQKPFKCQVCGAGFKTICNRNAHLRVHTGERLYSCQNCGKSFAKSSYLKKHIRRKHGEDKRKLHQIDSATSSGESEALATGN